MTVEIVAHVCRPIVTVKFVSMWSIFRDIDPENVRSVCKVKVIGNVSPVDRSHSYWRSTVTMVLSCIVSEINRDTGRKSRIFVWNAPVRVTLLQNFDHLKTALLNWTI